MRFLISPRAAGAALALLSGTAVTSLSGAVAEYFDHAAFLTNAGCLRVINFDSLPPGDNTLSGSEFAARGVTIIQRDGLGINVVQNTVPGGYGANFVTAGNINSASNAISSSIMTQSASPSPSDNFDFVLAQPATAAGLYLGNLGEFTTVATVVEFLDATNGVVAGEIIDATHPGMITGSVGVNWDNRIFYGIVTDIPIKTIRVTNQPNDGDGIVIDDVQFTAHPPLRISRSGADIRLDWPADVINCPLQSTTTISLTPIPWTSVTNAPTRSGNDWVHVEEVTSGNKFFRLHASP